MSDRSIREILSQLAGLRERLAADRSEPAVLITEPRAPLPARLCGVSQMDRVHAYCDAAGVGRRRVP